MTPTTIKSGDTDVTFTDVIQKDGSPFNLTGATVNLVLRSRFGGASFSFAATPDPNQTANTGKVTYGPPLSGSFPSSVGTYSAEWEVTVSGEVFTYPEDAYQQVTILESLSSGQVNVVAGTSFVVTKDFTDAQLKTMNTTPLVVIPAAGSGKILVPLSIAATAYLTSSYASWPSTTTFEYTTSSQTIYLINDWDTTATPFQSNAGFSLSGSIATFTNLAIALTADAAPTGGNTANFLRVSIAYFVQ